MMMTMMMMMMMMTMTMMMMMMVVMMMMMMVMMVVVVVMVMAMVLSLLKTPLGITQMCTFMGSIKPHSRLDFSELRISYSFELVTKDLPAFSRESSVTALRDAIMPTATLASPAGTGVSSLPQVCNGCGGLILTIISPTEG